jgi:hypothetical protein
VLCWMSYLCDEKIYCVEAISENVGWVIWKLCGYHLKSVVDGSHFNS